MDPSYVNCEFHLARPFILGPSMLTSGHHAVRDVTPSAARPARRVKKTQIDSESSSSESEESSVGSAGSSSDEGDEMVVLDPDHVS